MDTGSAHYYLCRRGNFNGDDDFGVYDAFIASGAPEEKARKAAEAIAAYEGRFGKVENDLNMLKNDVSLLKWMNGVTWALCLGILLRLFVH